MLRSLGIFLYDVIDGTSFVTAALITLAAQLETETGWPERRAEL